MKLIICCEDNFGLDVIKKIYLEKVNIGLVVCLFKNKFSYISIKNFCKKKKINFFLLKRKINHIKKLYTIFIKLKPDVVISCHFNFILPSSFLNIARLGCINLHPALLPLYRGQSPQHWPIINNDKYYGLSVHYMTPKVDQGNIVYQKKFLKPKNIYINDLQSNLRRHYPIAIMRSLNLINSKFKGKKQKKNKLYKGKIKIKDLKINSCQTTNQALARIRAFSHPYSGARYKNLVIWKANNTNFKIKKNGLYKKKNKLYLVIKNKALILTDYNEI